jgi:integrase
MVDDYLKSHASGWRSEKYARQWHSTIAVACQPIWSTPVDQIDTKAVLSVLTPLWQRTPETASRVRGRIESVLDAARALNHIPADRANAARWRGNLAHLLPARSKVRPVVHHAALPYAELPNFMARLRGDSTTSVAAVALQLIILTAARAGEVLRMTWAEVDLDAALWTIPASRMKAAKKHCVPLSDAAIELLKERFASRRNNENYVFASPMPLADPSEQRRPLSNQSLADVMKRLNVGEFTIHGMRASFKTYCSEHGVSRDLAETALAHRVGNAVEQAYDRTDLMKQRRPLMQQWADYLAGTETANVVPLKRA